MEGGDDQPRPTRGAPAAQTRTPGGPPRGKEPADQPDQGSDLLAAPKAGASTRPSQKRERMALMWDNGPRALQTPWAPRRPSPPSWTRLVSPRVAERRSSRTLSPTPTCRTAKGRHPQSPLSSRYGGEMNSGADWGGATSRGSPAAQSGAHSLLCHPPPGASAVLPARYHQRPAAPTSPGGLEPYPVALPGAVPAVRVHTLKGSGGSHGAKGEVGWP